MNDSSKVITLADVTSRLPAYLATIFSQGNGHFGVRVSAPNDTATGGTIVNGFYESSPIHYGESAYGYALSHQTTVKLPDVRQLRIADGAHRPFKVVAVKAMTLNLTNGQLDATWTMADPDGKRIEVNAQSVLGQHADCYAVVDYRITALDYVGNLHLASHLELPVTGKATGDPRQALAINTVALDQVQMDSTTERLRIRTQNSGLTLSMALTCAAGLEQTASVLPGQEVRRTIVAMVSGINGALPTVQMTPAAISKDAADYWHDFWQQSDVEIDGDAQLNRAIRFNLFQLASAAGRNGRTNIAAKGVSGDGYDGHYFWDTEMYMLPFFTYTMPDEARALLMYRYHVLTKAKARARIMGVRDGALFAWRTINGEEASAYYPAGTAQYHIDGDIAYAVGRYFEVTGDTTFIKRYGLALVLETAKFWLHFGAWSDVDGEQRFCFFDVTGPDEYSVLVNNNYFTNHIAQYNMQLAVRLCKQFPDAAKSLGVTANMLAVLQRAANGVYLPFDAVRRINQQDDAAFRKPVWPFAQTPRNHYPLLLHYHPLTIYRYQVNKQADTLLADYLFDDVNADQLRREYDYYEYITTHDSSLSRSIFSALAARMGASDKAYSYFMDTARMDLVDLQGNAADGLHIANLGGSWLSLVTGFAGVQVKAGQLHVTNHLPRAWRGLTVRIQYRGRHLQLQLRRRQTRVVLLSGPTLDVVVDGQKQHLTIEDN